MDEKAHPSSAEGEKMKGIVKDMAKEALGLAKKHGGSMKMKVKFKLPKSPKMKKSNLVK